MANEIVLELAFKLEYIKCLSYECVERSYWESIVKYLKKNNISVHAYANPSPIEIYGDDLDSERLLEDIKVISDPQKVQAFKTFHGTSFYTGCNLLGKLFDQYNDEDEDEIIGHTCK